MNNGQPYSGMSQVPSLTQLSGTVQRRLVEGIRLYNQLPKATIVTSASSANSKISQAQTVADAALQSGVSVTDTLQLPSPVNTETEAGAYASRFGAEQSLILVTSALHMNRAMYWFHENGTEPIPAPCDYRVMQDPDDPLCRWCPSFNKVALLDSWLHEKVGLWFGRLKG